MAKQTFTTGQVLTAAQMTALQQTAMLGGDANARTASYVLVAGDAGNAITMSSTSSTTITVNTGIFAAGDIVTIVNINSGVCTITAGTATVTTSGSLALSQNQGGVLRFTSASAAIFLQFATPASGDIEGITTGANSGLTGGVTSGTADLKLNFTAKGQLPVGTGSGTTGFLTVGTNGYTLVADSAEATGLKWAAAATGSMTLVSSTSLSGTTTTISGLSSSYNKIFILFVNVLNNAGDSLGVRINGDTANNYYVSRWRNYSGTVTYNANAATSRIDPAYDAGTSTSGFLQIWKYDSTEYVYTGRTYQANRLDLVDGRYDGSAAPSSVSITSGSGSFSGTVLVFGA